MTRIHERPEEIQGRLVPGHWEGDLIKGLGNGSAVGTLVERTTRKILWIRLDNAHADTTRDAFVEGLRRIPIPLRKSMTYDQGKEMARHAEIAQMTGIQVYFADPCAPWQRGSNKNTNGLLRQYMPKGMDLSHLSQSDLDRIAAEMNDRPRKALDFASPNEAFTAILNGEPVGSWMRPEIFVAK